jgi:tRNA A-37 threonylcarbamoyl transferase component Bud32
MSIGPSVFRGRRQEAKLNENPSSAPADMTRGNPPLDFLPSILGIQLPSFRITRQTERLSGGLLNQVWRVQGSAESIPASIIVKWVLPYIASSPGIELDPHRIVVEARAMAAFEAGGALASVDSAEVRAPRLLALDEPHHLLIMEDIGRWPNLGAWLACPECKPSDAGWVGASLGRFIGLVHRESSINPDLAKEFDNKNIQRTRLELQYRAVGDYAVRAGLPDASVLGERALEYGKLLQERGVCMIMGDLWPSSVIVTDSGLRIIDWELAHYGRPSQDVGHLAAHLWMYGHRAPSADVAERSRIVTDCFLDAYRATLDSAFDKLLGVKGVRESAIHFGCEVLTRTAGVFQDGYLYHGLAPSDLIFQEAARVAAAHIGHPLDVDTFDALHWRPHSAQAAAFV